jgi:anti-anti-sigma factor
VERPGSRTTYHYWPWKFWRAKDLAIVCGRQVTNEQEHMTITTELRDNFVVAHLSGSLDMSAGKQFRESAEVESRQTDLILDLAQVDFMDSAGLAALVLVIRGHKSAGKRCALAAPTPIVAKTLKVTAIHQLAPIADSLKGAIRLLEGK